MKIRKIFPLLFAALGAAVLVAESASAPDGAPSLW